jgi:hypothetical protein
MANRDTLLLTKLIAEIAKQRRTDRRSDRMLAVIERQHELYGVGFDFADAPTQEKAAALEGAAIALAASALRLAAEGSDLFKFDPSTKELAHAAG